MSLRLQKDKVGEEMQFVFIEHCIFFFEKHIDKRREKVYNYGD